MSLCVVPPLSEQVRQATIQSQSVRRSVCLSGLSASCVCCLLSIGCLFLKMCECVRVFTSSSHSACVLVPLDQSLSLFLRMPLCLSLLYLRDCLLVYLSLCFFLCVRVCYCCLRLCLFLSPPSPSISIRLV